MVEIITPKIVALARQGYDDHVTVAYAGGVPTFDECLRAALIRAAPSILSQAAEGWRPIETAPKDGTEILVVWPQQGNVMALVSWSIHGYWQTKGKPDLNLQATHWRPKPPPPAQGKQNMYIEDLPNVKMWPQFWRRFFLLTLPISGPLYVACVIVCMLFMLLFIILFLPAIGIAGFAVEMWTGIRPKWALDY